jgi:peptidyl-prolyl cis-trans isomerase C
MEARTVVAKVGDTEITLGELIIARSMLPPQYAQFPNDVLFDGLVEQLVQQQLLSDALESVPARVDLAIVNELRSLRAAEVITGIAETAVTPEMVQAAYDERYANAEDVPEFRASHLLVETEAEAQAAKDRIDGGAAFADVARELSTDPAAANGGDLGWFGKGAMVPEFEDQITALDVGEVSAPFQTQFGWHVATLTESRIQPKPTLEDVRQEITAQLQEVAITAFIDEQAAGQTIERPEAGKFDPNLLDQVELLDATE